MSYSLDANVLLYASDEASPLHAEARRFLDRCATGTEMLCLCWPVLMAYVRIATHPAVFTAPLSAAVAMSNVDSLLRLPQVRAIAEGSRFWECYGRLAAGVPIRGNLVPDAHVAAILIEHGVSVIFTRDRDFRKFDGITPRDPFA